MRAELRLSIMRKLRSARRSAELSTTGTFTKPNEMWPFQIGRDMLLLQKRPPWRIAGHCVARRRRAAGPRKRRFFPHKAAASIASKRDAKTIGQLRWKYRPRKEGVAWPSSWKRHRTSGGGTNLGVARHL